MTDRHGGAMAGAMSYDRGLQAVTRGGASVKTASRGSDLCVGIYDSPPYDLRIGPMESPRLSINLGTAAAWGGIGGERERRFAARRYSLFFTPAGVDVHWRKTEPSRHLNFYFHPRMLSESIEPRSGSMAADRPLLDAHVPALRPLVDALSVSIVRNDTIAREATLSLSHLILATLAQGPDPSAKSLSPETMRRMVEHIDAHLDSTIRITDLAAAAAMPTGTFALCFKRATGCTPHRFILMRRIERAADMLRGGALDVAEVALACGFSSQQHLTTVMRRMNACTPGQLRRARLGASST